MITIENNDFVSKIIDCLQKHDLTNEKIKSLYLKLSSLQYEQATFNTALDCISELCDGLESDLFDANETIASLEDELMSEKEENENLRMRLHE